jgi:hypothetical protein
MLLLHRSAQVSTSPSPNPLRMRPGLPPHSSSPARSPPGVQNLVRSVVGHRSTAFVPCHRCRRNAWLSRASRTRLVVLLQERAEAFQRHLRGWEPSLRQACEGLPKEPLYPCGPPVARDPADRRWLGSALEFDQPWRGNPTKGGPTRKGPEHDRAHGVDVRTLIDLPS